MNLNIFQKFYIDAKIYNNYKQKYKNTGNDEMTITRNKAVKLTTN